MGLQGHRAAGQMDQHPFGIIPERRAGPRSDHRCRAGTRQERHLPRLAGQEHRQCRRLSSGRRAKLAGGQSRHARRCLQDAGRPCRCHRALHQHQSSAALSRQWPARGRLRRRAVDRHRGGRDGTRPGGDTAAQHDSRRCHAVQDAAQLQLRLRRFRREHGYGARHGGVARLRQAAGGVACAWQAARYRRLEQHREGRVTGLRGRRDPVRPRGKRDGPLR